MSATEGFALAFWYSVGAPPRVLTDFGRVIDIGTGYGTMTLIYYSLVIEEK